MIRSMTGFGTARGEFDGCVAEVEVRSVNHRYLQVKARLPQELQGLEVQLEALVRRHLARGSVQISVALAVPAAAYAKRIDREVLEGYLRELRELCAEFGLERPAEIATFLQLPGVVPTAVPPSAALERWCAAVRGQIEVALGELVGMRGHEGRALAEDLRARLGAVEEAAGRVLERAPQVVAEFRARLFKRMSELLRDTPAQPAEEALLRESALHAERCDISEEITRLVAHLGHFRELLRAEEPIGRKLDFLVQEMHRETNTLGAKAADMEIAREVVEIKAQLERIREQVQNIE